MFCTVHRILNVNSWGYEKVGSFGLDLRLDGTGFLGSLLHTEWLDA